MSISLRALLLLGLLLLPLTVVAETLRGQVHWQGQRQIKEKVLVEKGATLSIAPGSQLEFVGGSLEVAGTLIANNVSFLGRDWSGLVLNRVAANTRLQGSRFSGAKVAILINGGAPQLEGLLLENNQVGVELKQQSRALVRDCQFRNNAKVGLFVKEGSTATISGNRFLDNRRFGAYIYRANPALFADNRFEGNGTALMIAYFGSNGLVSDNDFTANQVAIHVDRSAKPHLQGNRLQKNGIGIKLQRRSDPAVQGNLLQANKLGILVSFSSYPQISGNDFIDNQLALQLEHQSSAWERANGAASREQQRTGRGAFGSKAPQVVTEQLPQMKTLDGTVAAGGNWWGVAAAAELDKTGASGNLSFIHDGHDQANFQDGGKDYPLDQVRYHPAASGPQFPEGQQ